MAITLHELFDKISALGRSYGAGRILLYDAPADGDRPMQGDINLAVYRMPEENHTAFLADLEDTDQFPSLIDFDVVFIDPETKPAAPKKESKLLFDSFKEKYTQFQAALERLKKSISDYKKTPLESIRDGVILRFRICAELAWKSAREYLLDEGYAELNNPKSVMRQAFADHLIEEEAGWIKLLTDRNLTSHVYDEETAEEVFEAIQSSYVSLFEALLRQLSK